MAIILFTALVMGSVVDFFKVISEYFSIFSSVSHLQMNTIRSFAEAKLLFFLLLSCPQAISISFHQLSFLQFHQFIIIIHVCTCSFLLPFLETALP